MADFYSTNPDTHWHMNHHYNIDDATDLDGNIINIYPGIHWEDAMSSYGDGDSRTII